MKKFKTYLLENLKTIKIPVLVVLANSGFLKIVDSYYDEEDYVVELKSSNPKLSWKQVKKEIDKKIFSKKVVGKKESFLSPKGQSLIFDGKIVKVTGIPTSYFKQAGITTS